MLYTTATGWKAAILLAGLILSVVSVPAVAADQAPGPICNDTLAGLNVFMAPEEVAAVLTGAGFVQAKRRKKQKNNPAMYFETPGRKPNTDGFVEVVWSQVAAPNKGAADVQRTAVIAAFKAPPAGGDKEQWNDHRIALFVESCEAAIAHATATGQRVQRHARPLCMRYKTGSFDKEDYTKQSFGYTRLPSGSTTSFFDPKTGCEKSVSFDDQGPIRYRLIGPRPQLVN